MMEKETEMHLLQKDDIATMYHEGTNTYYEVRIICARTPMDLELESEAAAGYLPDPVLEAEIRRKYEQQ
jgi:hypothetical protein